MKEHLVLFVLALTSIAVSGIKYDGLKVKFGWSDALADVEYFFTIPRTIHDVEGEDWIRTERPKGPMMELRMYCPPGRLVCPLYDTAGFVAGMQVAVPLDSMDPELKPERYFVKWTPPAADGEPSRDYWTATQYYVTEDSLKSGAGPTTENGATLQDGGVWIRGVDGKLFKISTSEAEIAATIFMKQNCVPNMGTHYYYNMTKQLQCDGVIPSWFAMVTKGELLGVGYQTFGKKPFVKKQRDWFETLPKDRNFPLISAPSASECFLDQGVKYGILSLHIYYISKPWELKCEAGDSLEPAPVMDRLALNGARYAHKIGDEIKKIVYG